MKKSFVFLFIATVCLAVNSAQPVSTPLQDQGLSSLVKELPEPSSEVFFGEPEEEDGLRFRRVTCDLLSAETKFGSLNHSACAAHCLVKGKGFRGGRCRDGVCHCRK